MDNKVIEKINAELEKLNDLITHLRKPNTGSNWDRKQTLQSLAPYTIEEAYEVVDAINRNNTQDLCDELGDLLLQIVYQSTIAKEQNLFNLSDVIEAINSKIVRRNPQIFKTKINNYNKQKKEVRDWETIKQQEKNTKQNGLLKFYLDSVSSAIPAYLEAEKLQTKAATQGFDWSNPLEVLDKVREELDELAIEIKQKNQPNQIAEYGDVLFTIINLGRKLEADFETSLKQTNTKFRKRFNFIERQLKNNNKPFEETNLEEMEKLWIEAKKIE